MSALTEAANDELDAQLLAQNNVIDGLSLRIAQLEAENKSLLMANRDCVDWYNNLKAEHEQQQAVMRQALAALESSRLFVTSREKIKHPEGTEWYDDHITALRNSLEGKQ